MKFLSTIFIALSLISFAQAAADTKTVLAKTAGGTQESESAKTAKQTDLDTKKAGAEDASSKEDAAKDKTAKKLLYHVSNNSKAFLRISFSGMNHKYLTLIDVPAGTYADIIFTECPHYIEVGEITMQPGSTFEKYSQLGTYRLANDQICKNGILHVEFRLSFNTLEEKKPTSDTVSPTMK